MTKTFKLTSAIYRRAAEIATDPTIEIERGANWGLAERIDSELGADYRSTGIGIELPDGKVWGQDFIALSACTVGFVALATGEDPNVIDSAVCADFASIVGQGPHTFACVATREEMVQAFRTIAAVYEAQEI